jgi:hypothetical protein
MTPLLLRPDVTTAARLGAFLLFTPEQRGAFDEDSMKVCGGISFR